MLPYVWNAQWGSGREDMVYKLANSEFDVVMCNSSSYYFDLAYDSDPREGGLDWSGLTDAKTAFDLEPFDMFKYAKNISQEDIDAKERLKPESRSHFLGIQAELWSETIHNADLVDYMTFPKLFGLAERAWGKSIEDSNKSYDDSYNDFVNTIGQRELIRLDNYSQRGVQYRIPPPGLKLVGGKINMNAAYPSLIIRYTTDGSEPTITSTLYEGEFSTENPELIRAKCFSSNSRSSRESFIN
jgi:hexosaminidase